MSMVTTSGKWDWQRLTHLLPTDVLRKILAHVLPSRWLEYVLHVNISQMSSRKIMDHGKDKNMKWFRTSLGWFKTNLNGVVANDDHTTKLGGTFHSHLGERTFRFFKSLVQDWQAISEEENLEMERQLNVINKPPIKSFKNDYGDIFDCIDIYKQHAFDHPLLKGHKVQMEPKNIPKLMMEGESPRLLPKNIKCPPGSVLIRRTTKEDLVMAKKMNALGLNHPPSSRFRTTDGAATNLAYGNHNFGAKTRMNVWAPSTLPGQYSVSGIWVANGPFQDLNVIEAGCGVHRLLFSDNRTRLIAYWTGDGHKTTGCYNYLCPGFVQVHREISLGLVLDHISVYNGAQSDIEIGILKVIFSDLLVVKFEVI
ncbi:hypothetical protein V6N11_017563 [Hibiscus sabdariffa]|uniref:Neprosin PEP catalytic domain-containing protein n=1 Tax=Hibiscus sabdariffa TaxID=183260 RepID=A0ABR2TYE8_9ROSI